MSRGRIARWMLEEVGEPYETVLLDYGTTMKAPEYLAINPMGKVPAIKHGDTSSPKARRSAPISPTCFPTSGLAPPPGNQLRGAYYRWMFFGAGPVETAVTNKAAGSRARAADDGRLWQLWRPCSTCFRILSRPPALICSATSFTALDVYLGSQIGWGIGSARWRSGPASRTMSPGHRPAALPQGEGDRRCADAEEGGAARMNETSGPPPIALYDRFTHEGMDRRAFMAELTRLAGGTAAANALLAGIAAEPAAAAIVPEGDPRLQTRTMSWELIPGRKMSGYGAAPAAAGRICRW
jgi:glutathione S-transferase